MAWLIGSLPLARAAHVSLRQLDFWYRTKLVRPAMDNHKKLYNAEEAIQVMVIAELLRKGATLFEIRNCWEPIKRELVRNQKRLNDCYLAIDGKVGAVATPHTAAVCASLVASKDAWWILVDVGPLVARLPQSPLADPSKAA